MALTIPEYLESSGFGAIFKFISVSISPNAFFEKLTVRGYPYQNISTNSHLAKELFQGTISISDPNLKMMARAAIDLRGGKDRIFVKGQLVTAFVKKLNIYPVDFFVKSSV